MKCGKTFEIIYVYSGTKLHFRERWQQINTNPSWYSNEIKHSITERNFLHMEKKVQNSLFSQSWYEEKIYTAANSKTNPKSFPFFIKNQKEIKRGTEPLTDSERK